MSNCVNTRAEVSVLPNSPCRHSNFLVFSASSLRKSPIVVHRNFVSKHLVFGALLFKSNPLRKWPIVSTEIFRAAFSPTYATRNFGTTRIKIIRIPKEFWSSFTLLFSYISKNYTLSFWYWCQAQKILLMDSGTISAAYAWFPRQLWIFFWWTLRFSF